MKKYCLGVLLLSTFSLMSCGDKKFGEKDNADSTAVNEEALVVSDTTIFGVSGEFGMSTFTLITDSGDTLNVSRTGEDGIDGCVAGSLEEGKRYAMTVRENGESIARLINLSQVEAITKDYKICNAHLILMNDEHPDTVEVLKLTDTELVVEGSEGKRYELKK